MEKSMKARKSKSVEIARKNGAKRVRYAVVGLGNIAQVAVLPAFAHGTENSEVTALVTDDPTKAKQLSKKYCIGAVYPYKEYGHLLSSGEVDAVYIALPNNMHRDYSVEASNAGIHVLCEKPMATTEAECLEMIRAAEQNRTKLMIAYRLHFDKANLQAVELVQSGKLGEPRLFNSTFTMQVKADNIRLKREMGGGPLWDIGVYCINAARYLFRAEPEEVFAFEASSKDKRFREVEESVSVVLRFPDAQLGSFVCSFGAADVSAYEVVGTKGTLRADPAYEYAEGLKQKITIDGKVKEREFGKSDQFGPELVYFSDCILKNKEPEPSGKEGLADVRVIRALYESLDKGKPVRLKIEEPEKRPSAVQEIRKPPIQKPEMIHAESSSAD
jgi:glucose-fructose oxidoreductase